MKKRHRRPKQKKVQRQLQGEGGGESPTFLGEEGGGEEVVKSDGVDNHGTYTDIRCEVDFANIHASVREKNSLGRLPVPKKTVLSTVRGHYEVVFSGHNHGQRIDFPCQNNSTLTVST